MSRFVALKQREASSSATFLYEPTRRRIAADHRERVGPVPLDAHDRHRRARKNAVSTGQRQERFELAHSGTAARRPELGLAVRAIEGGVTVDNGFNYAMFQLFKRLTFPMMYRNPAYDPR